MSDRPYSVAEDFSDGVRLERLQREMDAAEVTNSGINRTDDAVSVLEVPAEEGSACDAVVAAHDGAAPAAVDDEYMVEEYHGNKLVRRTVYSNAAMTIKHSEYLFAYQGNALHGETLTEYDADGVADSSISWEYETENVNSQTRLVTKTRTS